MTAVAEAPETALIEAALAALTAEPVPGVTRLPTDADLPCSDGIPLESNWHVLQLELLRSTLDLYWAGRQRFFAGGNMFLYFSVDQFRNRDFRGPDFFVALDVEDRPRRSWVVWDEGKAPDVVIEFLSESTAEVDRTEKKQVYQDQVRIPECFWYDPATGELAGFSLRTGVYEPIPPDEAGRLASDRLGLLLVRWKGSYGREEGEWLRWATPDGVLLPTPEEKAEAERSLAEEAQSRAEEAQRRAEEALSRAERLAERLRALGVDPDEQ